MLNSIFDARYIHLMHNSVLKSVLLCHISQLFLHSFEVFYFTSTDVARVFVVSCWRKSARPALERSVSLSHCSRGPTSNSTGLLRGLLPCQDISHLHSESTLADLPSQAAIIKITCEKSWGIGSKAYGILAPHFLNWDQNASKSSLDRTSRSLTETQKGQRWNRQEQFLDYRNSGDCKCVTLTKQAELSPQWNSHDSRQWQSFFKSGQHF